MVNDNLGRTEQPAIDQHRIINNVSCCGTGSSTYINSAQTRCHSFQTLASTHCFIL